MSHDSVNRLRRLGARIAVVAAPALAVYAFAAYYVAH